MLKHRSLADGRVGRPSPTGAERRGPKAALMFLLLALCLSLPACAQEEGRYALVQLTGAGELLLPPAVEVDLDDLAAALDIAPEDQAPPVCFLEQGEELTFLLSQFDPAPEGNGRGTLSFVLPPEVDSDARVRVYLGGSTPPRPAEVFAPGVRVAQEEGRITITGPYHEIVHDPQIQGGLPGSIVFQPSGKSFSEFRWNDRVYDKTLRGFYLRDWPQPQVELLARGPVRTVVRVRLSYGTADRRPDTHPAAVYDFSYYPGSPLIGIRARMRQQEAFEWPELHFIEINFPGEDFLRFVTSDSPEPADLTAAEKTFSGKWAALLDGDNTLGLCCQSARIYDGRGGYGTYLHGPWEGWTTESHELEAVLYASGDKDSSQQFSRLAAGVSSRPAVVVSVPAVAEAVGALRGRIEELPAGARRDGYLWALGLAERGQALPGHAGVSRRALETVAATVAADRPVSLPDLVSLLRPGVTLHALQSAELGLGLLVEAEGGVSAGSLFGFRHGRDYLAPTEGGGLFRLELVDAEGKQSKVLSSGKWAETSIQTSGAENGNPTAATIRMTGPAAPGLEDLSVTVTVRLEGQRSLWHISVSGDTGPWGLRNVAFPTVRFRRLPGGGDFAFVPNGSGVLSRDPVATMSPFRGTYPSGWCSMQLVGYYDAEGGVYFAAHDPVASTKVIDMRPAEGGLGAEFCWAAPDAGVPGAGFEHPGDCVLQLYDGDWFDAAGLYKAWARAEAGWWPTGEQESRPDTPQWMKEVCIWALSSGGPEPVVQPCIDFADYMGVPTALHWYSWHQIPFDDDYPHYFPVKEGFVEGVKALQDAGVRVMPYINGRLWDKDTEDFPTVAFPAATKNEQGDPYIETYGSGQELVPMCPTQELWQDKVQEIVLRLVGPQNNVDGVYIDQIGAAAPRLCHDKSHGHPLGGGHWWTTDGYWPMLQSLQARLPEGKMITTECNAESYCKWMDGYLSWHFQEQGQIPLFAAVYGGHVQIFSRAYRADKTGSLMKAAQSLVYGEQIGWLNPRMVLEDKELLGPFLRRLARLRHALLPYLSWGEMARPPVVEGDIPQISADWGWRKGGIITDTALQRGAWRSPEGKLALIFVNVLGEPLEATLRFDAATYGLEGEQVTVRERTEDGPGATSSMPPVFEQPLRLAPYQAVVYEVAGAG